MDLDSAEAWLREKSRSQLLQDPLPLPGDQESARQVISHVCAPQTYLSAAAREGVEELPSTGSLPPDCATGNNKGLKYYSESGFQQNKTAAQSNEARSAGGARGWRRSRQLAKVVHLNHSTE